MVSSLASPSCVILILSLTNYFGLCLAINFHGGGKYAFAAYLRIRNTVSLSAERWNLQRFAVPYPRDHFGYVAAREWSTIDRRINMHFPMIECPPSNSRVELLSSLSWNWKRRIRRRFERFDQNLKRLSTNPPSNFLNYNFNSFYPGEGDTSCSSRKRYRGRYH